MKKDAWTLFWKKVYRVMYWHALEKPAGALLYHLPVKKNRVVFDNFGGKGFGDNPKYIAQALHKLAPKMEMIWLEDNLKEYVYPDYVTPVKIDSLEALWMRATAKVWVDNVRHLHPVRKKKGQVYLQTWHGPFAQKLVEGDAKERLGADYIREAVYDGQISDGILVDNKLQEEQFCRAFWLGPQTELLRFGLPRSDALMNTSRAQTEEIRRKLGFSPECAYILYAPTFRDDHSTKGYELDFQGAAQAFSEVLGKESRIIVRLHPNAAAQKKKIMFTDNVLDGSNYPDIQELSLACDCEISDYSSALFDFAMLHKPAFVCALDLEEYETVRGLVKEFYQLPFPLARSNEELLQNIREYSKESYDRKVNAFFETYPFYDKGDASIQTAQWILNKIGAFPE